MPLGTGGYEAKPPRLLAGGHDVASVEIPTIYDGEPSHYRPLADGVRVARALGAAPRREEPRGSARKPFAVLRAWMPRPRRARAGRDRARRRADLPAVGNTLYLAINGMGDGPEWLYQGCRPPYAQLPPAHAHHGDHRGDRAAPASPRAGRRAGRGPGAYFAGVALEIVKLFIERARPEEVLGGQVQLSHDRSWAHIASYRPAT